MRQNLSLRVEQSKMLEYSNLGGLLESIAESPEIVEEITREKVGNSLTNSNSKSDIMSTLSFLFNSENGNSRRNKGLIMNGGIDYLEDIFDVKNLDSSVDVIYEANKEDKPTLHFNDRLIVKPELLGIQIPNEFKRTQNIYAKILKQHQWQAGKLREVYGLIGNKQREFIRDLDKLSLNKYNTDDLSEDLGFSSTTTAYRLIGGRQAYINPINQEGVVCPIENLLCTNDKIKEIHAKDKLIKYFLSEKNRGSVLSDKQLCEKLGLNIARKTVSKYREQLRIPGSYERKKIYSNFSR